MPEATAARALALLNGEGGEELPPVTIGTMAISVDVDVRNGAGPFMPTWHTLRGDRATGPVGHSPSKPSRAGAVGFADGGKSRSFRANARSPQGPWARFFL